MRISPPQSTPFVHFSPYFRDYKPSQFDSLRRLTTAQHVFVPDEAQCEEHKLGRDGVIHRMATVPPIFIDMTSGAGIGERVFARFERKGVRSVAVTSVGVSKKAGINEDAFAVLPDGMVLMDGCGSGDGLEAVDVLSRSLLGSKGDPLTRLETAAYGLRLVNGNNDWDRPAAVLSMNMFANSPGQVKLTSFTVGDVSCWVIGADGRLIKQNELQERGGAPTHIMLHPSSEFSTAFDRRRVGQMEHVFLESALVFQCTDGVANALNSFKDPVATLMNVLYYGEAVAPSQATQRVLGIENLDLERAANNLHNWVLREMIYRVGGDNIGFTLSLVEPESDSIEGKGPPQISTARPDFFWDKLQQCMPRSMARVRDLGRLKDWEHLLIVNAIEHINQRTLDKLVTDLKSMDHEWSDLDFDEIVARVFYKTAAYTKWSARFRKFCDGLDQVEIANGDLPPEGRIKLGFSNGTMSLTIRKNSQGNRYEIVGDDAVIQSYVIREVMSGGVVGFDGKRFQAMFSEPEKSIVLPGLRTTTEIFKIESLILCIRLPGEPGELPHERFR